VTKPSCSNLTCPVPLSALCRQGHDDYHDCPAFRAGQVAGVPSEVLEIGKRELQVPWTGYALTTSDASLVWGLRRAPILALIGLPGSGKTSFLGTLYLLLKRGPVGVKHFAGSLTLQGWANITSKMYWAQGQPPRYPDRTSGEAREPGYLHLSLADGSGIQDVLLADTPGEWYVSLLKNAQADDGEAARSTIQHADVILFFIDLDRLTSSTTRYLTERNTTVLLDRIAAQRPGIPLVAVYAKRDRMTEDVVQSVTVIQQRITRNFPDHQSVQTVASIPSSTSQTDPLTMQNEAPIPEFKPGQGVAEAVERALELSRPVSPLRTATSRSENASVLSTLIQRSR
jgi:hypothetical protein